VKAHLDLLLGVASFSLSTTSVLVESSCSTFGKVVISSSARFAIASLYSTSSSSLATYMTLKKNHLQFILIKICQSVMPCYIDCYLQTIYINFSPSVLGLGFIKICQSEKLNNKSGHKYEYCKTKLTPYNRLNCICKSLIILRARLMRVFILAI
jgi:hypothetical protein